MKKSAAIQAFWLGVLILVQPVLVPASEGVAKLPVHKQCIDEPIFKQRACIYEVNREAEQTVVLVHGLNGQALRDWAHQIQPLARHYHVLTFDLPGFGASDKGASYYSPSRYARFIRYITERYAKRPFNLIGHSMGGAIVLRYTADNPEDVKRLVLVDVAGVLHRMAYARMLAAAWVAENYGSQVGGFLDRMTNKFITKVEGITSMGNDYLARKLLEHELVDASPPVVAAYTLANEDLSDALMKIQLPVLMLWGQDDKVAPLRTASVLKARLPRAKLVTFAGAGHSPMNDVPDLVNRELLAFLLPDELEGPEKTEPRPSQQPLRQVECRNASNKVYTGSFDRMVLDGCSDVVIRNATIGSLQAMSSRVRIENSRIGRTGEIGLIVTGSELTVTAGEIRGKVPIHASRSRLDLAGVILVAGEAAVTGDKGASLIFSVSELRMNGHRDALHGYFEVDRKNALVTIDQ